MTKISRAAAARAGWRGMVAGSALALAMMATAGTAPTAAAAPAGPLPAGPASAAPATASPLPAGPVAPPGLSCRQATGPFTVQGTRVLDQSGNPFVSYGITVPGLQVLD